MTRTRRHTHPAPRLLALLLLAACQPPAASQPAPAPPAARSFPAPARPVADIVSDQWSDEASRDSEGEAAQVIRLLRVRPGQTVADIGAGSGYYVTRLSPAVGAGGRVFANDIMPDYLARLRARVKAAGLTNVTTILGDPDDAKLPPASTDIALMVHMYHEIAEPYALLWNLHDSLKPASQNPAPPVLAILDADRPTHQHGTPPALLQCELAATGYTQTAFHKLPGGNYLALFTPTQRPDPATIKPCRAP